MSTPNEQTKAIAIAIQQGAKDARTEILAEYANDGARITQHDRCACNAPARCRNSGRRSCGDPEILMKTLIQVPVPKHTEANSRWWPDLYLRKGRRLLQVTPEQASKLMDIQRDGDSALGEYPRSRSEVKDIRLHDIDGRHIGFVSFNGRVWLNDIDGRKEIPLAGVKTAAQHEANGWKDFLCNPTH